MELNKIYCEDCRETMGRMDDGFIDLTVTSPPYDNLRTYNDNIDEAWGEDVWKPIIKELYRVTKEGGVVVWVVGDATIDGSETGVSFQQALWAKECGFNLHDTMIYKRNGRYPMDEHSRYWQDFEFMFVWSKSKPNTFNAIKDRKTKHKGRITGTKREVNGDLKDVNTKRTYNEYKSRSNIWNYFAGRNLSTKDEIAFNHSAIYPEGIPKDHIRTWSNEGDLVYDPFMGSGTTAKMAHLLKRKWIGSELSQEYVDLAYKRLEPYLTQTTLF